MLTELIDKQDNFEIIRDKIAFILVTEIASQMSLATAAGKNPADWDVKIFTERSNPWEQYLNATECGDLPAPIANIWFDNSSFDQKSSDIVQRQTSESVFNIDCYGYGRSSNKEAGGHTAGDKSAALAVQKAIRLIRNILMAATYTYLDLRGVVGQRWPQSITVFQPQIDGRTVQNVVGARIALRVKFNEFSPQVAGEALEYVSVKVYRAENGLITTGGLDEQFEDLDAPFDNLDAPFGTEDAVIYFTADYDYVPGSLDVPFDSLDDPFEDLDDQF